MTPLRLRFILCKVLQREAYLCASRSRNVVDCVLMPQGLHNEPERLRAEVQRELNVVQDVQGRPYDACLLGYGLCSNGVVGLTARIRTVVPRAHDCLTVILGSKHAYQRYFDSHRGVYWYTRGWIETGTQPGRERYETTRRQYLEKYGEDNADYLMQMEQGWIREYRWATYVDWGLPGADEDKGFTRECAEFLGWSYDCVPGDPGLLQRLVDGEWDEESFLVLEPGRRIAQAVAGPEIIKAAD
jgi:hypothetical protein